MTSENRSPPSVRLSDRERHEETPDRRAFLRTMALQGVSVPAAYIMLGSDFSDQSVPEAQAAVKAGHSPKCAMRQVAGAAVDGPYNGLFTRDFTDPYIELIRLLREASEIEHALMIQYLYATFSIKPAYESLVGFGDPNSNDLLGVAIQEMQHLGQVNRLLMELGAAPNLVREDFPYEPDIYPFELNLEPLSRRSVAKYLWTEAPAGAFDRNSRKTSVDRSFVDQAYEVLGTDTRPNHVGSLYSAVIALLKEVMNSDFKWVKDLGPWIDRLQQLKAEGEVGHFEFFKQVFMGTHPGFNGEPDIWSLPPDAGAYPAMQLPVNPSAYVGHENQIEDPVALSIAWLGNLHYWIMLSLLNHAYREGETHLLPVSQQHMLGPIWSIARHLPTLGAGIPFDPLSMGYAPGRNAFYSLSIIVHLLDEAEKLEQQLADQLPEDYPSSIGRETREVAQADLRALASKPAVPRAGEGDGLGFFLAAPLPL